VNMMTIFSRYAIGSLILRNGKKLIMEELVTRHG